MAVIYAIQNGNWSDGTTWNTGSVPTADDDVYTNGYVVNISQNDTITAQCIHNTSADGITEGGNLKDNGTYSASNTITIISNIDAINNIVNCNCKLVIIGDVYSLTTISTAASTYRQNATFYFPHTTMYTLLPCIHIIGNVVSSVDSVGMIIAGAHQYTNIAVDGNITHNSGYFSEGIRYQATQDIVYINGNIEAFAEMFKNRIAIFDNVDRYGLIPLNGNWVQHNGAADVAYFNHSGDLIIEENAYIHFYVSSSQYSNYGNVHVYTLPSIGNNIVLNIFPSASYKLRLHNFYNHTNCQRMFGSYNWYQYFQEIVCDGEFHTGNPLYMQTDSQYFESPLYKFTALAGCKFYHQNQNPTLFAKIWSINEPETFEFVYEGVGNLPPYKVIPITNDLLNTYPYETNVKKDVKYGPFNEFTGEYQSTILTDEQLQRIANCATVSTVQKCFEDFKE